MLAPFTTAKASLSRRLTESTLAATVGQSELAELATERGIPTRGGDANSLRDALREWAAEQLDGAGSGGASQSLFPAGYLEERARPFSNAEGAPHGRLTLVDLAGALVHEVRQELAQDMPSRQSA